jgi:hypothetical protein
MLGGVDLGALPRYHVPLQTMNAELLARAMPSEKLYDLNPGNRSAIDAWLKERGFDVSNTKYQGLKARQQDMTVFLDAKTANVIGIAPFKPWP